MSCAAGHVGGLVQAQEATEKLPLAMFQAKGRISPSQGWLTPEANGNTAVTVECKDH